MWHRAYDTTMTRQSVASTAVDDQLVAAATEGLGEYGVDLDDPVHRDVALAVIDALIVADKHGGAPAMRRVGSCVLGALIRADRRAKESARG